MEPPAAALLDKFEAAAPGCRQTTTAKNRLKNKSFVDVNCWRCF
jgi:hypothetical protein